MTPRFLAVFAALVSSIAAPAHAQQNAYGGHDIVGPMQRDEIDYAETRGWLVFTAGSRSGHAYCVAEISRSDGSPVRLGWDGHQWQLAVPVASRPDWQGTLRIDGRGSGQGYGRGGDYISGTSVDGWTIAWLGQAELNGLRKGNEAVLGVEKFDYDIPLAGVTAASLKVQECVERGRDANAGDRAAPVHPAGARADGCPAPGSLRSAQSSQPATLHIANSSFRPLRIYWIDQEGERRLYQELAHGQDYRQPTYVGHSWIAVDDAGNCVGHVMTAHTPGDSIEEIFGDD
ncbi:hypothetical protein [Acuticoccus kandeliae]|uniref:VHL beta domain-containing protein n=1 Tax=Acuticoccus kandeliae TaxID=2073160 RepID=UPI00196A8C52|nr:hypothetical protein [Acuticoccus kandeliae]